MSFIKNGYHSSCILSNELADITAKDAMQNGIEDKTNPTKSEIYTIINKAIMNKWQQYWDQPPNGIYTGRAYHHVQPKVKKDTIMYSSNRLNDKVYSILRLGHSRLGLHCAWVKYGICTRCPDDSFEDGMHVQQIITNTRGL